jgi:hypothetical protein
MRSVISLTKPKLDQMQHEQQSGSDLTRMLTNEDDKLSLRTSQKPETIAHHHHKTVDAQGNIIDVVTDLNVTDYRHTCRTCKELESVFYSQKITPKKKVVRDTLTPRPKQM